MLNAVQPGADGVVGVHQFQMRRDRHAASMGGLARDADQFQRQAVIDFDDRSAFVDETNQCSANNGDDAVRVGSGGIDLFQ